MSTFAVRLSDHPIHKGVLVRLTGEPLKKRRALNLTLVLDVSGSMSRPASMPSTSGASAEKYAFTLLDTVKHACKAIAQQMGETDVLSLVSFSTNAIVQFAPQKMSTLGRESFFNALRRLEPDQQTNLYAGIELGANTLRAAADIAEPDALHQVIVLTDGESNMSPAIGNIKAVEKLVASQKRNNNFVFTLNTLALGFDSMQSKELARLARLCNQGGFTYIPDMGMVGSVFVNLLSTMFSTVEQNIQISVSDNVSSPSVTTVPLLQSGQVIDVWIPVQSVSGVDIVFNLPNENQREEALTEADVMLAHANHCLLQSLELEANRSIAPHTAETFKLPPWCTVDVLQRLPAYIDIVAEGMKALLPGFYAKWGCHYLQSLYSAHSRRVCNNFKDEGVQQYATPFFIECQADGNIAFNDLPPPAANPSCGGGIVIASSSCLNNNDNPCVHGDCLVLMADCSLKMAKDIVKGDVVQTEKGTATIECVLKTVCAETSMCILDLGLIITPYHPIWCRDSFEFPINISEPTIVDCGAVFSFLLGPTDVGETMIIQGENVLVLGSNSTTGIAKHPFFSPYTTISNALKQFKGWASGQIVCSNNPMIRDTETNLVKGFDYTKEIF